MISISQSCVIASSTLKDTNPEIIIIDNDVNLPTERIVIDQMKIVCPYINETIIQIIFIDILN